VSKPAVIVLDEPNTYVDSVFQQQMYEQLAIVNKECAVVCVSHDLQAIARNAHKVWLVNHNAVEKPASQLTKADIEQCFGCAPYQNWASEE